MDLFNAFWQDCHDAKLLRGLPDRARSDATKAYARYRALLRQAQAFTLDNSTLETLVNLSVVDAKRMRRRLEMARLPFGVTWIEYDFHERLRHAHKLGLSPDVSDIAPNKLGLLIIQDQLDLMRWSVVEVVSKDERRESTAVRAGIMPGGFMVDLECRGQFKLRDQSQTALVTTQEPLISLLELLPNTKSAEEVKLHAHLGWGYGGSDKTPLDISTNAPLIAKDLDGSIGLGVEIINTILYSGSGREDQFAKSVFMCAYECRGDIRFLVTVLALINDVPCKKVLTRPQGRFLTSHGNHPFLSSNVVTISVPGRRPVRWIDNQLRRLENDFHKKRHRVRGHFRTFAKRPNGDGWAWRWSERYQAFRWAKWIDEHERGDAKLGWVEHQYQVQKSPQN